MASVPNTLLIDGNDIRTLTGITVKGDLRLRAPGLRRGGDDAIPGRRGELPAPGLPLAAYNWSIFVNAAGVNRGQREAHLEAAATILNGVGQDGLITMTRRIANSTDDGYVEATAQGRFLTGWDISILNPLLGTCEWQFRNLDGAWRRTDNHVLTF